MVEPRAYESSRDGLCYSFHPTLLKRSSRLAKSIISLLRVYYREAIMMRWTRLGFSQLRHNTKQSAGRKRSRFRRTLELEALEQRDLLSTFTVTNTSDSGPGSLRQAILDSNGTTGQNTIQFQIATSGVQTITPMALQNITNSVIIDGTTEPGFDPSNPKPLIELSGS